MADKKVTAAGTGNASTSPPPQIHVDTSALNTSYANFFLLAAGTEELVVDFGLLPPAHGKKPEPIRLNQRVVLNYYNAKKLMHSLAAAVQNHEKNFGPLEFDTRKRVIGGNGQAAP